MASMNSTSIELSIVIPTWNEATRLPRTLERLAHYLQHRPWSTEIIIADDGSTDGTAQVALQAGRRHGLQLRVVSLSKHEGPGIAIRAGMLASLGNKVLISDADGPVPFEEIDTLYEVLNHGASIAAGSRTQRPEWVEVKQPPHRILMGHVWRQCVQFLARAPINDTQCGFKLFQGDLARTVFRQVQSRGFVVHVESLVIAEAHGAKIREIPVRWADGEGSKVNPLTHPFTMLGELVHLSARRRLATAARSRLRSRQS